MGVEVCRLSSPSVSAPDRIMTDAPEIVIRGWLAESRAKTSSPLRLTEWLIAPSLILGPNKTIDHVSQRSHCLPDQSLYSGHTADAHADDDDEMIMWMEIHHGPFLWRRLLLLLTGNRKIISRSARSSRFLFAAKKGP